MKVVLQRVKYARVKVDNQVVGEIQQGLLLLLGIHPADVPEHADFLVEKCSELRIFEDQDGKMNLSAKDIAGAALIVSQFTLYGDCRKGRRPSFTDAARPEVAVPLYEYFVQTMRKHLSQVETGIFGASMQVELLNDGPVTLILEK
jgi:D-aminoacyl-tRNA deacylase